MLTALGIAVGQTVWAFATSAGIVAILVASEPLFLAVKYAGAAYLVYLGFQALREAIAPSDRSHQRSHDLQPSRRLRPLIAFRQGLISDLGNPKMAVFFASLLPQFAPAGPASFSALLFLGVRDNDIRLADALRDYDRQGRRFSPPACGPARRRGCHRDTSCRPRRSDCCGTTIARLLRDLRCGHDFFSAESLANGESGWSAVST